MWEMPSQAPGPRCPPSSAPPSAARVGGLSALVRSGSSTHLKGDTAFTAFVSLMADVKYSLKHLFNEGMSFIS